MANLQDKKKTSLADLLTFDPNKEQQPDDMTVVLKKAVQNLMIKKPQVTPKIDSKMSASGGFSPPPPSFANQNPSDVIQPPSAEATQGLAQLFASLKGPEAQTPEIKPSQAPIISKQDLGPAQIASFKPQSSPIDTSQEIASMGGNVDLPSKSMDWSQALFPAISTALGTLIGGAQGGAIGAQSGQKYLSEYERLTDSEKASKALKLKQEIELNSKGLKIDPKTLKVVAEENSPYWKNKELETQTKLGQLSFLLGREEAQKMASEIQRSKFLLDLEKQKNSGTINDRDFEEKKRQFDETMKFKTQELTQKGELTTKSIDQKGFLANKAIAAKGAKSLMTGQKTALEKMSGEQKTKVGSLISSLDSLKDLNTLVQNGKVPSYITSDTKGIGRFISDSPIDILIRKLSDDIGRARSGGAINGDEESRFLRMLPTAADDTKTSSYKIQNLHKEFTTKIQTLGLNEHDIKNIQDKPFTPLNNQAPQKPLIIKQNGHEYRLNQQTGKYE